MKRAYAAILMLTAFLVACADEPSGPDMSDLTVLAAGANGNGNGAPTGWHYTLLIHGYGGDNSGFPAENGQNMWVKLQGNTKINLTEGDDFYVLDPDGTDGVAEFQLPNPDEDNDGVTTYSVFARGLGQGSATITTCADDPNSDDPDDVICNTGELVVGLSKGNGKGGNTFSNVSKELLYLWDVDLDGDGIVDLNRVPLFDDALEGYFWSYDNNGLRLAQLRFYPCSTDVGDTSADPINDDACFD